MNFTSKAKFNWKFKVPKPKHKVNLTVRKLSPNPIEISENHF